MLEYAGPADQEALLILRETLDQFWDDFEEEYRMVSLKDLDGRYSRFIKIVQPQGVVKDPWTSGRLRNR